MIVSEREITVRVRIMAQSRQDADRAFGKLYSKVDAAVPRTFLRADSASPVQQIMGRSVTFSRTLK